MKYTIEHDGRRATIKDMDDEGKYVSLLFEIDCGKVKQTFNQRWPATDVAREKAMEYVEDWILRAKINPEILLLH